MVRVLSQVSSRAPQAMLVALALAALLLGLAVYVTDRPAGHAALIPALPALSALAGGLSFGAAGGWLPSFVHPFAFALLTASLRAPARQPAFGACFGWWGVNLAFEGLQHPAAAAALAAGAVEPGIAGRALAALAAYAAAGTFDALDLAAVTLGALAAAFVLSRRHVRWELHHAQSRR